MTPLLLAIFLFAVGSVLLVAEFLIPAHGVTAGTGLLALLCGVVACFFVSETLGVVVLAAGATAGPVAAAGARRLFPRTRLGRRLVLPTPRVHTVTAEDSGTTPVRVGQVGVTLSALRPSGVCEFRNLASDLTGSAPADGTIRVQVISDFGSVEPGQPVRVIRCRDGRATVRMV